MFEGVVTLEPLLVAVLVLLLSLEERVTLRSTACPVLASYVLPEPSIILVLEPDVLPATVVRRAFSLDDLPFVYNPLLYDDDLLAVLVL